MIITIHGNFNAQCTIMTRNISLHFSASFYNFTSVYAHDWLDYYHDENNISNSRYFRQGNKRNHVNDLHTSTLLMTGHFPSKEGFAGHQTCHRKLYNSVCVVQISQF